MTPASDEDVVLIHERTNGGTLMTFWCNRCGEPHSVVVHSTRTVEPHIKSWHWNGDRVKPTIEHGRPRSGNCMTVMERNGGKCHTWIIDGWMMGMGLTQSLLKKVKDWPLKAPPA